MVRFAFWLSGRNEKQRCPAVRLRLGRVYSSRLKIWGVGVMICVWCLDRRKVSDVTRRHSRGGALSVCPRLHGVYGLRFKILCARRRTPSGAIPSLPRLRRVHGSRFQIWGLCYAFW